MNPATVKAELLKKHGESQKQRIDRGVDQIAALWRKEDGDLAAFAMEYFLADPAELDKTFARYEGHFETLDGHFLEIGRGLRTPSDLDLGPLLKVDPMFAAYEPAAHVNEDLFANKLGFVALLNFPQASLAEKLEKGKDFSRRQWAEVRLTGRFARRVPADVQQGIADASSAADLYINQYNIWMHHLLNEKGERLFPKGLRLITHWNLRDELKGDYADPRGIEKQRTIIKVMERIVTQTIPKAVIDNPRLDWNPFTNAVTVTPGAELEEKLADKTPEVKADPKPEPDVRYARLLANYTSARRAA
jgi:hypothetical protein